MGRKILNSFGYNAGECVDACNPLSFIKIVKIKCLEQSGCRSYKDRTRIIFLVFLFLNLCSQFLSFINLVCVVEVGDSERGFVVNSSVIEYSVAVG